MSCDDYAAPGEDGEQKGINLTQKCNLGFFRVNT